MIPSGEQWRAACECGSWSPSYGAVRPAPVLHFSREGLLPAECVTVLALNPICSVSLRSVRTDGANAYLCVAGESRRLVVFAEKPGVWHFETIESDAELLVIEYSGATIHHALISGGSKARISGEPLALERKIEGVWEGVANGAKQSLLSPPTVTALLAVLERLEGGAPSSVAPEFLETGNSL